MGILQRMADYLYGKPSPMNAAASSGWWPVTSGIATVTGVTVSEESAMSFSAVFCATRIIAEAMMTMPITVLEQQDYRTTRKATTHPLWDILHSQPNKEQDIASFVDMQTAFQVNWGNAYAEIQRDATGKIIALWPIHPCRVPLKNIKRNPRSNEPERWGEIYVGKPGELVYYVRNDDNTTTPIPASDMLHVPGVLSKNGVTGESIIRWAANSIGIGLATEQHAGAFFKNGAATNMAIKSPKVVGPETADRLREQWQRVFGGVANHYKTLLLEDGMEPVPINLSPEDSQLLEARKFPVTEIARWYRIPLHMLSDMDGAKFNNIESENISFLSKTMLPWIRRWEMAMQRQLLTVAERQQYQIKFNQMALLRGDSAARATFYRQLFDMASLSPNDIREKEDMNPVEGGDEYFVPANNLVPLAKIGEYVDSQMTPNATQVVAHHNSAERESIGESRERLRAATVTAIEAVFAGFANRESRAARQAANKPQTFLKWRDEFYPEFSAKLTDSLTPFSAVANAVGIPSDFSKIADQWLKTSSAMLDPLSDLPVSKLGDAVNAIDFGGERLKTFLMAKKGETCEVQ